VINNWSFTAKITKKEYKNVNISGFIVTLCAMMFSRPKRCGYNGDVGSWYFLEGKTLGHNPRTQPTNSVEQTPSWEANMILSKLRNSPNFMGPEGSLPHSQAPTNSLYRKPDQSSPCLSIPLLEDKWSLLPRYGATWFCGRRNDLQIWKVVENVPNK